jgi:hypothetical protein
MANRTPSHIPRIALLGDGGKGKDSASGSRDPDEVTAAETGIIHWRLHFL